jgi:lysophospholipase L1-like esterase
MPQTRWLAALTVVLSTAATPSLADAEKFFFQDGDTVVMLGDSITEQRLYSTYVEAWTVTRFPAWKLVFRNVGIGGDTSPGGNRRFQRDVVSFKPTALTVDFGMNDGGYRAFDPKGFQTYLNGLKGIASQAKEANIRVAWLTPSPVEKAENGPPLQGYNETLEKYSAGVQEVAASTSGLFVDQFHPFIALQEKARAADPKTRIGGGDPVHPGPPGQAVMAWAILKGMHFPTLVSSASIDAAAGKVAGSKQCQVSDLEVKDGRVRFQRQDAALPFFPEEAQGILKWAPIRDELNQYELRVQGLNSGRYEIRLGGTKVATHTAAELAQGVNLAGAALSAGPVAEQARAVWNAVKAKNTYYHDRIFRGVVLAQVVIPEFLDLKLSREDIEAKRRAAVAERLRKMPALDEAIREALVMKPHLVEVVPAGE